MQNIYWLLSAPVVDLPGGPHSDLASARYRALIPAGALGPHGYRSRFLRLGADTPHALATAFQADAPDILVVSKCFDPTGVAVAELAADLGIAVIVDFCDDHFDDPERGSVMRGLAAMADVVTVPTPTMGFAVTQKLGLRPMEVVDPFEGPAGTPRFEPLAVQQPGERLRLLWFGHPSNIPGLATALPDLMDFARHQPLHLEIVTTVMPDLPEQLDRISVQSDGGMTFTATHWNQNTVWEGLKRCDAVILPAQDRRKSWVKSPNRLVETIRAGRLAIAQPLPSFTDLAQGAIITDSLSAGLRQALSDPAAATARIEQGQQIVAKRYSPEAAALGWRAALDTAASVRNARLPRPPVRQVCLNLGCGDKVLPGYVNCDALPARGGGGQVDVQCDVSKPLPFATESVDEVMAIHVVEHLWRWEVVGILREWRRVLRPGGRIVLECPNLLSACAELLRNPAAVGPGAEGQRTMWVLYGDPGWKDPLMMHRWAYTPESLASVLSEAGFVDMRQEPAQFKLREPRDMRIVATAP